jgi:hypothetical protein
VIGWSQPNSARQPTVGHIRCGGTPQPAAGLPRLYNHSPPHQPEQPENKIIGDLQQLQLSVNQNIPSSVSKEHCNSLLFLSRLLNTQNNLTQKIVMLTHSSPPPPTLASSQTVMNLTNSLLIRLNLLTLNPSRMSFGGEDED